MADFDEYVWDIFLLEMQRSFFFYPRLTVQQRHIFWRKEIYVPPSPHNEVKLLASSKIGPHIIGQLLYT